MDAHLVILQVHVRVRDVLAWALGHVAALELGMVERVARVLPFGRLGPAQALRRPAESESESVLVFIRRWFRG